jgi:sugar/nucleoside kinase (ribokinase family)
VIVVAGHLCLDIIPALGTGAALQPGRLVEVGPASIVTGGAVSNVGLALYKLGASVRLVGRVGHDEFGKLLLGVLGNYGLADSIARGKGPTSYTVVVSSAEQDRMFLHCPGCNDTFVSADVSDANLKGANHFHFGYPSLMAAMSANGGRETVALFQRAKKFGLTTSLDTSYPDVSSEQGLVDWKGLLGAVLPYVDMFLPSEDELGFMLPGVTGGVEELAIACLDMGTDIVVIKRGEEGLYGIQRGEKGIRQDCFNVEVVGTTGSGDATIAGFLYGMSRGFTFEHCLRAGCAVGAFSVEGADAVSGIMPWEIVAARFFS